MGQQQLLLLVLGIVIVGLAVVVGIQAFSENQKKSNADALVNDAIRIASDADYENLNGVFELADDGADLTITATSYESDGTTAMHVVVLTVSGTTPGDIVTEINQ